jgi:hypothetical protein
LKSIAESAAPTGMVTSCPYQIMKRAANDEYHEESFFWNDASRGSSNSNPILFYFLILLWVKM